MLAGDDRSWSGGEVSQEYGFQLSRMSVKLVDNDDSRGWAVCRQNWKSLVGSSNWEQV